MIRKPHLTIAIAIVGLLTQLSGTDTFAATQARYLTTGTTTMSVAGPAEQDGAIDYMHAISLDLPLSSQAPADLVAALTAEASSVGRAGHSRGEIGNGKLSPVSLGTPNTSAADAAGITPQEFGTSNHPFSTARADLTPGATNTQYPYRASGKLFFKIGTGTFVCSASLIKRGLVVTAAHCVANFGHSQFYNTFRFVPGYRNGAAPFGTWVGANAIVLTSYFNGTDPCAVSGVVCRNDVAVMRLAPQAGGFPGTATGFYGFGFNGFGFNSNKLTHITQTGYPNCLDNGQRMERNDSHGFTDGASQNNTVIGSLLCGGSSGGPWLVNFGIRPTLTGTGSGTASNPNIVVGVTSWGYTNSAVKQQGASPFLSTNIVVLVNTACAAGNPAC